MAAAGATGAALAAGITSLSVAAATAVLNNNGDIGAALKELGSKENVRNVVTAMVTAGVVSGLGNAFTVNVNGTPVPLNQVSMGAGASATQVLARNLVSSTANAVIGTAINGGSLGDNLTQEQ